MKNILQIFLAIAVSLAVFIGCNKDDYAKINTDPSSISEGNIPYLFTNAFLRFQPADYLLWFYNGNYTSTFVQSFTPGSYGSQFNIMGELGGTGSQFVAVLNYQRQIEDEVSRMSSEEGAMYQNIQAMISTLAIYLGILDTDLFGSMPYSEACRVRYGGSLTPNYDSQEQLFNEWIEELDNDINILSSNLSDQISLGNNDPVYGGDPAKWLKFANGVKLKIAVRLLHQNKSKALSLAAEVGANEANIMTSDEDFIYNKGIGGNGGDYTYQTGNSVSLGSASKNVVDFMKRNSDPRMLVMFTKNSFNAEVVQAFFDAQFEAAQAGTEIPSEIPSYILENVEYSTDSDGHKTFTGWSGPGEPWVRFYGCPVGMNIQDNPLYTGEENYFNSTKLQVTLGESTKTYNPRSYFNEELVRGRCDYTFPTKPGGAVVQDTEDRPWYGMTLSAGEVNLYLAEFKLLGATLPGTAAAYFSAGVEASAKSYNALAEKNMIPYFDASHCYTGDPFDKPITYGDEEIAAMLENSEYQLSGNADSDLEKVYIQQYIHFMYLPIDQFVTVRRSGVPKVNSSLIPWVELTASANIPRRMYVTEPTTTDKMRTQKLAAYEQEGFSCTSGDAYTTLNSERVWYDKGAPNFGEGPNY